VPAAQSENFLEIMSAIRDAQRRIEDLFPECNLHGNSADELCRRHRFLEDPDSLLSDLIRSYNATLARLEEISGWKTGEKKPPILVLENFRGVDIGIGQLRRVMPLETEAMHGIRVPVIGEMLRIKAWMVLTGNAMRDYIGFTALFTEVGDSGFAEALGRFDSFYPQAEDAEPSALQLVRMLCEPMPYDLNDDGLAQYDQLSSPLTSWRSISARCATASGILFDVVMSQMGEGKRE